MSKKLISIIFMFIVSFITINIANSYYNNYNRCGWVSPVFNKHDYIVEWYQVNYYDTRKWLCITRVINESQIIKKIWFEKYKKINSKIVMLLNKKFYYMDRNKLEILQNKINKIWQIYYNNDIYVWILSLLSEWIRSINDNWEKIIFEFSSYNNVNKKINLDEAYKQFFKTQIR